MLENQIGVCLFVLGEFHSNFTNPIFGHCFGLSVLKHVVHHVVSQDLQIAIMFHHVSMLSSKSAGNVRPMVFQASNPFKWDNMLHMKHITCHPWHFLSFEVVNYLEDLLSKKRKRDA